VEVSAIPIYNTNGDLTMVVSYFHDITVAIEQSRKIEEQKKELESIIENIVDGISIFNDKGKYILFNKSEREMFFPYYENMNKTSDAYKQFEFYDIDGEKINSINNPSQRVMRGEKFSNMRVAVKFIHRTLQIDVSGTPIYDSQGKFSLGVLCSRDMTAYLKHEEDIRNRYEFMNKMIETFDLPVVRLSCPDLKIVDINKKAFSILKMLCPNVKSIKQIKDNNTEVLFKILKPSKYAKSISEVLKENKTKYLNKQKYWVNGNEKYWNVIFEPMPNVNGEITEILILTIDVTNEIKSNLVMKKALKSQGEFITNISHDLKTPLNVIFAAVQLISMYCDSGSLDERKNSIIRYLDSIKQNSYRLSKLINNIVDQKLNQVFLSYIYQITM
jgi:signal transduction histidine kinase